MSGVMDHMGQIWARERRLGEHGKVHGNANAAGAHRPMLMARWMIEETGGGDVPAIGFP